MLQLEVRGAGLARWACAHDLPLEDEGYLLHRLLRDAFGSMAPQPFRWFAPTDRAPGRLLGYGRHCEADLRSALSLAEPLLDAALPQAGVAAKAMPQAFAAGTSLGFEVRACPIVRTRRGDGESSRELDVFLHRALAARKEVPVDRDAVYREWLNLRLARGGAELTEARVHRLDQTPLVRRHHSKPGQGSVAPEGRPKRLHRTLAGRRIMARRPDVTFRGLIHVVDPDRFAELLAKGVGRHRAFGFGMLLLRPA
jgi:CRISPR system Cascade subunit CasE